MLDIKIDISEAVNLFSLDKTEVDSLRELTVISFVTEAYNNTVELAQKQLNQSRNEYISALHIVKEDQFTYSLQLSGSKLASMVEMGIPSFDMKIGFRNSLKAKPTKSGGWYLIIPFQFRTTAANPISGNPGALLPRRIYDLIRNSPDVTKDAGPTTVVSILKNQSIPQRYQPQSASVINQLANTAESYIPKSSIYAGLVRTQDITTGKSTYNTFRAVSNNSDPMSWIHPGIKAYNLMDQAFAMTDQEEAMLAGVEKLFQ